MPKALGNCSAIGTLPSLHPSSDQMVGQTWRGDNAQIVDGRACYVVAIKSWHILSYLKFTCDTTVKLMTGVGTRAREGGTSGRGGVFKGEYESTWSVKLPAKFLTTLQTARAERRVRESEGEREGRSKGKRQLLIFKMHNVVDHVDQSQLATRYSLHSPRHV